MPKTFEIELIDGKHQIFFDNYALYRFEEVHGRDPYTAIMTQKTSVMALNHFIWAGLLHQNENVTIEWVTRNFDYKKFHECKTAVEDALEDAFPKVKGPTKKKEN